MLKYYKFIYGSSTYILRALAFLTNVVVLTLYLLDANGFTSIKFPSPVSQQDILGLITVVATFLTGASFIWVTWEQIVCKVLGFASSSMVMFILAERFYAEAPPYSIALPFVVVLGLLFAGGALFLKEAKDRGVSYDIGGHTR